jgi:hypothetical protein
MELGLAAASSKSFTPRPLRKSDRDEGAGASEEGGPVEHKGGEFFGVRPKKLPQPEETHPLLETTLRRKVHPKNFVSQLRLASNVATFLKNDAS